MSIDQDFSIELERYELRPDDPFALDRRAFLKTAGLGLVVLCLFRRAGAQESGRSGRRGGGAEGPEEIGAWLQIGEDGAITAFTGKVEVGQNARTSLSQAVADELNVPVDSVRMVMGDTSRVPYDRGTFGSRTTPTMVPQLRRAAAAARGLLLGLAADRLGVDRSALTVADGAVTHPPTGRSLSFGTLTEGRRLVETIETDVEPTPGDRWERAGQPAPKVNGRDFVTGQHRYASDESRPGMLRGKVLRPPAFGATLKAIDASEAEAIPGAVVVRDGDFVGVAAPDESTAERALTVIRAEWETPEGDSTSDRDVYSYFKEQPGDVQRLNEPSERESGSIDRALAGSDRTVEARYTVAYIAHTPLEPRAAVAEWEGDRLTVWTGTQRPFGVRDELVEAFRLPAEAVRVLVPDTGSGYGGKHTGEAAIEAARLARAAGEPVKLVWSRTEEFTWAYFRPAGLIEARAGVRKDGTLTAWEFFNYNSGGSGIEPPYEIADRLVAVRPARSPLRQGSYRALASTANHYARESLIDELADAVGIDPLDFRLRNLRDDRLIAVLKAAADRFGWGGSPTAEGRGVGLACGAEKGGYVATCAEVAVDSESRTVRVVRAVTAFECGAIVNPAHLENQVEGAVLMGLGGALFEAIRFESGKVLNAKMARYRVPRFSDLPALETVLIDRPDLPSAGAGESPIVAIAPAIGNALFAATGRRFRSMPMATDGKISAG